MREYEKKENKRSNSSTTTSFRVGGFCNVCQMGTAHGAHSIHHLVFVRETEKATQREEREEENGKKAIYSVYLYFSRTLCTEKEENHKEKKNIKTPPWMQREEVDEASFSRTLSV